MLDYRDAGYHPDAVVNYLSLLAWSSESGDEFLTRERLVREVDLDRVGRSNAEVDPEKMRWLSGLHLRSEPPERRAQRVAAVSGLAERADLQGGDLVRAADLLADRVQLVTELAEEAERIFRPPDLRSDAAREGLGREEALSVIRAAGQAWAELGSWTESRLEAALGEVRGRTGASGRGLYQPLRAALTGEAHGPALSTVALVLGRDRTLDRLERASAELESTEGFRRTEPQDGD